MSPDVAFLLGAVARATAMILVLVTVFIAFRPSNKVWFAIMLTGMILANINPSDQDVARLDVTAVYACVIVLIGIGWRWGDIPTKQAVQ